MKGSTEGLFPLCYIHAVTHTHTHTQTIIRQTNAHERVSYFIFINVACTIFSRCIIDIYTQVNLEMITF